MTTLLVGFDAAWTATNSGAIVAVIGCDDGEYSAISSVPVVATYAAAQTHILNWQKEFSPTKTIVMLDQPAIVKNATGQRPVENLAASPVGLRYGGVQPANKAKSEMFGKGAPIWSFLERFGGPSDPQKMSGGTRVIETYPVLAMIALNWLVEDTRPTGRLPKYNPQRSKTFLMTDWKIVCNYLTRALEDRAVAGFATWLAKMRNLARPTKSDQDCIDACICLLVGTYLAAHDDCLLVGNMDSGYMVVPHNPVLRDELERRCRATKRDPENWVKKFHA